MSSVPSSISGDKALQKRLASVQVLIADPDTRIAEVVRRVLQGFGFNNIVLVKDGQAAMDRMKNENIDLLICEWSMEPVGGLELIKFLRSDPKSPSVDLPIIMLTGQTERYHVEEARDSGVTEYLAKPFTAKTLSHRLIQVIEHPRMFIQAPSFVGPDRRRKSDKQKSGKSEYRRTSTEEMIKKAKRMPDGRMKYVADDGTEIFLSPPNNQMKRKIGPSLKMSDILSPDVIENAQAALHDAKDDFIEWIMLDMERMEKAYADLKADMNNLEAKNEVQKIAFNVMSQSGSFNFPLGTQVGKLMHDYVRDHEKSNITVIRKHIDMLYVIFQKRIEGTDQEIAHEVVTMLQTLIRKFKDM